MRNFRDIVPPEILVQATYPGADAQTLEQSVATPLEAQISGVDNMNYMYSVNANNGQTQITVNFDIKTDPNIDQVLTQLRTSQAQSQLPAQVNTSGLIVQKSLSAPLLLVALYSPKGSYDSVFLANYAYINLVDELTRVPGMARVQVFGAGQYAMRFWVKPDQLAKLQITVPADHRGASSAKHGESRRPDRRRAGSERPAVHLHRARAGPSALAGGVRQHHSARQSRWIDAASERCRSHRARRADLQSPGPLQRQAVRDSRPLSTARLECRRAAKASRKRMAQLKARFPQDLDYQVSLDTTRAVTAGMEEIVYTLLEALALVVFVVYIFLQGWRATLIPLLAVPVSLIGTFVDLSAARLFHQYAFSVRPRAGHRPGR